MTTPAPAPAPAAPSPAASPASAGWLGSETVSNGVRVRVNPAYLPDQSDPQARQFFFSYRIRITNEGPAAVTLVSRRWRIIDARAGEDEVTGPGVVGQQPRLEPGRSFEYASFCPLVTPWGTMEGSYRMRWDDGTTFEAEIARFYLVSTPTPAPAAAAVAAPPGAVPAPGAEP